MSKLEQDTFMPTPKPSSKPANSQGYPNSPPQHSYQISHPSPSSHQHDRRMSNVQDISPQQPSKRRLSTSPGPGRSKVARTVDRVGNIGGSATSAASSLSSRESNQSTPTRKNSGSATGTPSSGMTAPLPPPGPPPQPIANPANASARARSRSSSQASNRGSGSPIVPITSGQERERDIRMDPRDDRTGQYYSRYMPNHSNPQVTQPQGPSAVFGNARPPHHPAYRPYHDSEDYSHPAHAKPPHDEDPYQQEMRGHPQDLRQVHHSPHVPHGQMHAQHPGPNANMHIQPSHGHSGHPQQHHGHPAYVSPRTPERYLHHHPITPPTSTGNTPSDLKRHPQQYQHPQHPHHSPHAHAHAMHNNHPSHPGPPQHPPPPHLQQHPGNGPNMLRERTACDDHYDPRRDDDERWDCVRCGKVFRHVNCLKKHSWEHHESWESLKEQLNLSKNQQVEMMEAAQILLYMFRTAAGPTEGPFPKTRPTGVR